MKCKAIQSGNGNLVENNINEWLDKNLNAKISFVSQSSLPSTKLLITTIFYED